jgi:formate/nitrite transporter FocA (FNT family)
MKYFCFASNLLRKKYHGIRMEPNESPLDQIITHAEDYLKTRQQLTQHVITEKVVVLTSTLVTGYVLFAVFVLAAFFSSMGLALWISHETNDPLMGYWLVGAGYFVMGLLLVIFRKSILKTPLMNAMVKNIYNENNHG